MKKNKPKPTMSGKKRITAKELRALSLGEQKKILEQEAENLAKEYEIIEDGFDIVEY